MTAGKVLIYGATGGIGAEIARDLAKRGHQLHLVGRNTERLAAIAAELGTSSSFVDVTDPATFSTVMQQAGGSLAGLVYAVGTITLKPISRLTPSDFDLDYRINALGAALAVQAAIPALRAHATEAGRAAVLLFSSVAVQQGFTAHASIAMAKGAVEGLSRSLAAELAPGIRVNAIAPSLTRTGIAAPLTSNEPMVTAISQLHALQRIGEPADIAKLGAFLISSDSDWITGQVFAVDGGRSHVRTKG
jgi:NAD(P)-dependent dehydrogenase (short-subunit alcohol dehydrogenase family)